MKVFNTFKKKKLTHGTIILLVFYGLQLLTRVFIPQSNDQLLVDSFRAGHMYNATLISEVIFIGIICYIYRDKIVSFPKWFRDNYKRAIPKVGMYLLILIGAIELGNIIDNILFPSLAADISNNHELIITDVQASLSIPALITIVILTPIVEEFVFRHAIINDVLHFINPYIAAIISSLVFTLLHVFIFTTPLSGDYVVHLMLAYMPLSLCYSYIYIHEKHKFYNISVHILNNALSIALSAGVLLN